MKKEKHIKLSRFISFVLRHKPEAIGLNMDMNGYVEVEELIKKVNATKHTINKEILNEIIESDNKNRYSYDPTKTKVRANQGHSFEVNLELAESTPPPVLYHGTSESSIQSIMLKGILKQSRHHVHLSADEDTALDVGSRRSKPVVLQIDSAEMTTNGYKFYLSENNIWLTDEVPASYILNG